MQRIWAEANLKPHRVETFKFSTDPALEAMIRDSVRGGGPLAPTPEQCDVWGTKEHHGIPDYPVRCIMPAGHEGNHKMLVFTYPDGTKG